MPPSRTSDDDTWGRILFDALCSFLTTWIIGIGLILVYAYAPYLQ